MGGVSAIKFYFGCLEFFHFAKPLSGELTWEVVICLKSDGHI